MDYAVAIERVYEHIENDHVDKAVMTCLRLARHLHDYLHAAIFLHELYPDKRQLYDVVFYDTQGLKEGAMKLVLDQSLKQWFAGRTLEYSPVLTDDDDDRKALLVGIGEIDPEIVRLEGYIKDMTVPAGMGEYDTAAFTDDYTNKKAQIRLHIKALHTIKERVKTRCLNYAIQLERQLQAQKKPESFMQTVQRDVNNYFKAHSEDVYTKLQTASQLIDSTEAEDLALLLTEVRRAIKAVADFFYPAVEKPVTCSDGSTRQLGDQQYMNRIQEYLATITGQSNSDQLLRAELDYWTVFARRLNTIASKGVHSNVSAMEAKQGLLGLYMFLYNVISRLEKKSP